MIRRTLGATGLSVTTLGLGLAALGRPAYITLGREIDLGTHRSVEAMERRCHEMLDAAYAAGIRYIDAARSYGLAEAFLASWLEAPAAVARTGSPRAPERRAWGWGPTRSEKDAPAAAVTIGSTWGYAYVGDWRLDAPVHEVKDLSLDALRRQVGESRGILGGRLALY